MTVVCLAILAGIFWGDFFLKNYIESHVDERDERADLQGKTSDPQASQQRHDAQCRTEEKASGGCCFTGVYTDIDRCLYRESGTSRQQFAATGTGAVAWWCLQQYL